MNGFETLFFECKTCDHTKYKLYIYIRTKLSINDISRAKIRSACVIVSDLFLRNGTNSSQRCYLRQ